MASRLGLSVTALQEAAAKNPVTLPEDDTRGTTSASTSRRLVKVSASTELICRLALLSPEVRVWLSTQTALALGELDPELELLSQLLPPLEELRDPSPSAVLALIPEELQSLVSAWELEKMPVSPLAAVQDAIRNLQMIELKKRQATASLKLKAPGLTSEKMIEIQKEILDLQGKFNDLFAPAA